MVKQNFSAYGSWKGNRMREEGAREKLKPVISPVTFSLQVGPTHCSSSFSYSWISPPNGLNQGWGQNTHYLIIASKSHIWILLHTHALLGNILHPNHNNLENHLQIKFNVQGKVIIQLHSSTCGYSVLSELFIEEAVLSSLYILGISCLD